MSPTLNGSSALEHYERGNVIEICNGIMFNFYPGLPQLYSVDQDLYSHHYGLVYIQTLLYYHSRITWTCYKIILFIAVLCLHVIQEC